jgi:ankyrin repeat protein
VPVDINYVGDDGRSLLIMALKSRRHALASYLLAREDVNVNLAAADGETPLVAACSNGMMEHAEMIIDRGCTLDDSER